MDKPDFNYYRTVVSTQNDPDILQSELKDLINECVAYIETESVTEVPCSVGLSCDVLCQIARAATDEKKELFKKHDWVFNHKITPGDVRIIIEMYEKHQAR